MRIITQPADLPDGTKAETPHSSPENGVRGQAQQTRRMEMIRPLVQAAEELRESLRGLTFSAPVTHTYQPLDYAWQSHRDYLICVTVQEKNACFFSA